MSLLKTAANGMLWTTAATVVRSIASFLQVSILTRYLSKTDFGVIAIATLFIGFSQIFMDMGISNGIMHKQDTTPKQYSSLFWINIIMGVFLSLLVVAISPLVASAYSEPELVKILSILGSTLFFSSLGSQHRTVQQKKLRFKYIAINEILTAVLTVVIAFYLAFSGFGVYSLVYSTVFQAFFSNILFLCIGLRNEKNISFHLNISEVAEYFKIGSFAIGSQILNYFARELDVIIISSMLGKDVLGVYSLCKKLVQSVYNAVNPILMKVMTPILSQLQTEKDKIGLVFTTIVESLALTNFPIYILIAVLSKGILNYLYGFDYIDASIQLSLLAIYYGYLSIGNPIGSLQVALGRTDLGLYWDACRLTICAVTIYLGSHFGINYIILLLIVSSMASMPLFWRITIKPLINIGCYKYFMIGIKPLFLTIVLAIPFFLWASVYYNISNMILVALMFMSAYLLIIYQVFKNSYMVTLGKRSINTLMHHNK